MNNDKLSMATSAWERSSLMRFFRWLFGGRILRRLALGAAWIATVIALAYGVENWRGRRAWNQYRTQLEARGTQLDLAALIPKPVPDDRNFAATPLVQSWFDRSPGAGPGWKDDFENTGLAWRESKDSRRPTDLPRWAWFLQVAVSNRLESPKNPKRGAPGMDDAAIETAFPSRPKAAAAVLKGLQSSDARLGELREASRRPESRYPVVYDLNNPWGILLPHLSGVKGSVQRLHLRACAKLAVGDAAGALDDIVLGLNLTDSLKGEPFMISALVRMSCVQILVQPIWEGLVDRRWSDPQLLTLQSRLSEYQFLADLNRSLESERAAAILTADQFARGKYRFSQLEDGSSGGAPNFWNMGFRELVGVMAPRGWYQLEKLNYCRLLDRQMDGAFDATKGRVMPERIATNTAELESVIAADATSRDLTRVFRHQFLASLLLPALKELPYKAASAQTAVDQARLACALERFRLAEGSFPESLTALVPKFIAPLPKDLLSGEPYRYRRSADGAFVLYSIGWNGKDDGGVPGKVIFDKSDGDWVWDSR